MDGADYVTPFIYRLVFPSRGCVQRKEVVAGCGYGATLYADVREQLLPGIALADFRLFHSLEVVFLLVEGNAVIYDSLACFIHEHVKVGAQQDI